MTLKLNGTNSEAAPAYAGDDADTGLQCGTNELKLVTGGTARATVDSSGNLGVGTESPTGYIHVEGESTGTETYGRFDTGPANGDQSLVIKSGSSRDHMAIQVATIAGVNDDLSLQPDGGNVGIGKISSGNKLEIEGQGDTRVVIDARTDAANGSISSLQFWSKNGSGTNNFGQIDYDGDGSFTIGSNGGGGGGVPIRFRHGSTDRMVMRSDGDIVFHKEVDSFMAAGVRIAADNIGLLECTRSGGQPLALNRLTNDGHLIQFYQAGNIEGAINVSGSSVTLVGGHLSRWSQFAGGAERIEILRGSVLSNLDEMCEWGDEDNEQLNRMKVSDVEGDVNVAGVFQDWDDDDDTYSNDFHCAMTGDFVIRIAQGTTVARGDLLMSAGDGTAKPQDDDIVRSKTIAKVTSTTVSTTYSDGSYCVPCVLMAC